MSTPVTGRYRPQSPMLLAGIALYVIAVMWIAWPGLQDMVHQWGRGEYSHGFVIPLIALYIFALKLPEATAAASRRRWWGLPVAVAALALVVVGRLSGIHDLAQYGFILSIVALVIALLGARATRMLWAPIVYLLFMVPLPQFIYLKLSAELQLIASQLGAWIIGLAGLPVFLEGNIIDLGVYKLQVAEACSGLRYLFPLMSFGFLFAVLYRGPAWGKVLLFVATVPITIIMNSLRVGVTGLLVENFGIGVAEGFLHWFEGWLIFLVCVAILFLAAWGLHWLTGRNGHVLDTLDLRLPELPAGDGPVRAGARPVAAAAAAALAVLAAVQLFNYDAPPDLTRRQFALFPSRLGPWHGQRLAIDRDTLEVLAADDWLLSDYVNGERDAPVSLFIAYFRDQSNGRAVHSPEVCIPGAGWEIRELSPTTVAVGGATFTVNRAIIQKGTRGQVVYYWFDQRGRRLVNEYAVKWYIFWDGLTRHRTDGSLVRLVTPIRNGGLEAAEDRLSEFMQSLHRTLPKFLPS